MFPEKKTLSYISVSTYTRNNKKHQHNNDKSAKQTKTKKTVHRAW